MRTNKVSVVLPIHREDEFIKKILTSLAKQSHQEFEIIIIDSTMNGLSRKDIDKFSNLNIKIFESFSSFPGQARNVGISFSSYEIIAFIDLTTIPSKDWLEEGLNLLERSKTEVVLGKCKSLGVTYIQKLIRCLTYGAKQFECLPGALITKKALAKSGVFFGDARAGEDIEWIQRIYSLKLVIDTPKLSNITYYGFPKSFYACIRKWYKYSLENAKLNILTFQKFIYLYLFLFGFLYFVYSWNFIFTYGQWDQSSAFIPNLNTYLWSTILSSYFILRSIILPLKKGEKLSFLLPFNWLLVGIVGFTLDVVKIPGRIFGVIRIMDFKRKK